MEMWHIWAVLAVLLFIVEIFTPAFLAACLGIGAAVAAVVAGIGLDLGWQFIFFAAGILSSFFLVRPFVKKYLHKEDKEVKTNVDALVGRSARVSVAIDNSTGEGRVVIDGDDWKAVTADGDGRAIAAGQIVEIIKVDSTILTVK